MTSKTVKHDSPAMTEMYVIISIVTLCTSNEIIPEHLVHLAYRTVTYTPAEK